MNKRFFVSFEGIDGVGKTTQVARLSGKMAMLGLEVVVVREPGGTALGEIIREVVKNPAREDIDSCAEACLYAAARAQLVAQVVLPALAAQKVVLADRFVYSTIAYQGAGRGLPEKLLEALNSLAAKGLEPDLCIVIDVPVQEALNRVSQIKTFDRIERLESSFFERVRNRYLQLVASEPSRFVLVDGTKTPAEVEESVFQAVRGALQRCMNTSGDKIPQ